MRSVTVAALVVLSTVFSSGPAGAGMLDPALEATLSALAPGETLSVIVEMADQADLVAASNAARGLGHAARVGAVKQVLERWATRHQGPVRGFLAREQALGTVREIVPFWIFNGLAVTATQPVIRQLAARDDVLEVRPDRHIPPPVPVPAEVSPFGGTSEWNIAQIRAPEVWALDPNYTGVGTVVGSFDTGVDGTHPELAPRYRGNDEISWYDPYKQHTSPFDADGHGTHTTGTAVGGDAGGTQIGVAPGATWIAAKGWNDFGLATTSAFHKIFEWFLAPGGDPANAPDVVNMSWSFLEPECDPEFVADIQALRAAGIFPAFASGNDGPAPGSARSPGAYPESFAVGATDFFDDIAYFSGRGPSACDGAVKPDVSAPGVSILSTVPGGYASFSGTSMAAPHVTGAVAVLRSIDPAATVEELETALELGVLDLGPAGADNDYGEGRIDLFVSAQVIQGGPDRPIVTITTTDPSLPEAGATTAVLTVQRTGSTDADLTVLLTVAGTAIPGSDYVTLPDTVMIPAGSDTAAIVVTPIDDPLPEFDETVVVTLNLDPAYIVGNPGSATVTIISDEVPPDLTVTAFSAPATAAAGATLSVSDTTENRGGPADPSTTRFYLSTDAVLDGADVPLANRSVPSLGTGESSSATTSIRIPDSTAPGFYYLIAKADADDAITEITEGNNTALAGIHIGPDLIVLALSAPATSAAGATVSVSDTTKNQGGAPADASTTTLYFSTDVTLDPGDPPVGSRSVPALEPGASSAGSTSVTIPTDATAGIYYLIAEADGTRAVTESRESNNTALAAIQVGSDLIVLSLSAPTSAAAGSRVTVTDTTKNRGGGTASASTTRLYFSTDPILDSRDTSLGRREVPDLAAGASSSGPTPVTLPRQLSVGTYYIIARADADDAVAETQENNNVALTAIRIGPDLFVSAFSAPALADAGTTLTVSDTTTNQGGPAGASTTRFFLSTDPALDAADVPVGSRAVPALATGTSSTGTTAVTIPGGTAAGTRYLIAQADADNALAESLETNNTALAVIQIGPDLVIAALSVPGTVAAGTPVAASVSTKNQGGGGAGASTTRLYFSTNTLLDAGDTLIGSRTVPPLNPGSADAGTTTVTIPAGTAAGAYYLLAQADAEGTVSETQEANNLGVTSIQIGADLIVFSLSAPSTAKAGATIVASDTTRNQSGAAAATSTTRFYLSTNTVVDAADVAIGSRAVPGLAAGASSAGSTAVTIPAGTATGFYYLLARADADDAVLESVESNNTALAGIRLGPDVVLLSLSAPSVAAPGATIVVSDTTRNQGGGDANPSTTRLYFSTNALLDAGDTLLGSRAVPALPGGMSSAGTTAVTLPTALGDGLYYLIARADADDAVAETDESNNVALTTIRTGPDLVISTFTAPASGGAGGTVVVSDTTSNQGGGSAGASTTRLYFSTDPTLDPGDALLGSRSVPPLGPGTSSPGTTTVTVPAGTAAGFYYIIAKADADNALAESEEANNMALTGLHVGPDLAIAALSAPAPSGAGATIAVTDTTRNQGGGAADPSTTTLYLSTDTLLDAGDTLLASRAVPTLAPGASNAGTTSVTIPAGVAAGTYYLLASADDTDAVAETQEGNNVGATTVLIGADLIISALSAPVTTEAGATVFVSDTTRNQSGTAADTSTTRFYLSSNALVDGGDTPLGTRAVPALGGGASDAGTTAVIIPAATAPGFYYILAEADAERVVPETQEANNVGLAGTRIGPDLIVLSLSAPGAAGAGTNITVTDTTRNQGGGAAGPSATALFFSSDPYLDGGDVLLGSRAVPALAAVTSSSGATPVTLPTGLAVGTYYLIARADTNAVVDETNEGNNTALTPIRIGPDLIVAAASVPGSAAVGTTISVTDTTMNQGGDAAGASTTRFYLSVNAVPDGGDVVLGSRSVPALVPGATSAEATALTIPTGTPVGGYYFIVEADAVDAVGETFEWNNTTLRWIQITSSP